MSPSPSPIRASAATAFASSAEHILAELERIDLMIRARIGQFRHTAEHDERFRGLYISDDEIDALLARPLGRPHWPSEAPRRPERDRAEELTRSIAERRKRSAGVELRLERVVEAFGLDDFDRDVLLIAFATELDLRYERLYAYLQDDVTRRRPSVDLVINLLAPERDDLFAPRRHFVAEAPLLRHRLIALVEDPQQPAPPLPARYVRLDDRIASYLAGGDDLDDGIAHSAQMWLPEPEGAVLPLEGALAETVRNVAPGEDRPVLLLVGGAGSGKTAVAAALAHEAGRPLLAIDADRLARFDGMNGTDAARLATLIEREARLRGAMLLWRGLDRLAAGVDGAAARALLDVIDRGQAPAAIALSEPASAVALLPARGGLTIEVPALTLARRLAAWRAALPELGEAEPDVLVSLAAQFRLSYRQIDEAARIGREMSRAKGTNAPPTRRHLIEACRINAHGGLSKLARKVRTNAGWGDLVLPEETGMQLREMCAQVRHRDLVLGEWGFGDKLSLGTGTAALFSGPSGTGKTMAAGVIATELGLDLYKIDLANVVNKYIGETEKNLGRVFDEARDLNAILFFDEADALFGKRSEVRDAHDRYANVEVGYLLQRMEEHDGIAILATNLRRNMDDAFVRRLSFILEFPFPSRSDRRRIWETVWPQRMTPPPDLDLDGLAALELTGGNIRNIALAAAYLAAEASDVVRMEHIRLACQREHEKIGKLMLH